MSSQIYQMITDRILELLENGVIPWRKPWKGGASEELPANLVSKKTYRGINIFLLSAMGFSSRYWLSYKQAQEKGGQVRKGEKGTPVIFWKTSEVDDKETGKKKQIPVLRYYTVFNLDQVDGIERPSGDEIPETFDFNPIEEAEKIIGAMPKRPEIQHGQPRACYRPSTDTVNMPRQETFEQPEEYYSTLFHELTHATGHESRLGRRNSGEIRTFGDVEYSKEELIAEMGAAYLCGFAGIERATIENSAAYLAGWIKTLKGDSKLAVCAAANAQKAADFILGVKYSQEQA